MPGRPSSQVPPGLRPVIDVVVICFAMLPSGFAWRPVASTRHVSVARVDDAALALVAQLSAALVASSGRSTAPLAGGVSPPEAGTAHARSSPFAHGAPRQRYRPSYVPRWIISE